MGFPHRLTLNRICLLEIWCGRQRLELSNHSCICLLPVYRGALLAIRNTWVSTPAISLQEASGIRPDGGRVVHHRTDELLIQQDSVPDGETTYTVKKRTQHFQSLERFVFSSDRCMSSKSTVYQGSPLDNRRYRPKNWLLMN